MKKAFCTHVCKGIYRRTRFIENAPVIVVILAKLNFVVHRVGKAVSRVNIQLIDIGISGEHFVLRAQELGIGTCWINLFNVKKAAKILALPNNYKVVSLIAMGYPAEGATRDRPDLPMENILYFNDDYKMRLK
jgi:nitroreductase